MQEIMPKTVNETTAYTMPQLIDSNMITAAMRRHFGLPLRPWRGQYIENHIPDGWIGFNFQEALQLQISPPFLKRMVNLQWSTSVDS